MNAKQKMIPSREKQTEFQKQREALKKRAEALEAPSLKFETLKEHIKDFLDDLKIAIDGLLDSPSAPFESIIWSMRIFCANPERRTMKRPTI